jgi:hypothetical protein
MGGQQERKGAPFVELARLCVAIRRNWYPRQHTAMGERYLYRLGRLLERIPKDDPAIIRHEALAWFHQLRRECAAAVMHRREEIRLIQWLHEDVRRCVESGVYDQSTAKYALQGRDLKNLRDKQAILRALEAEVAGSDNGAD